MELEGREAKLLGSLAETISLTKTCCLYVTLKPSHSSSKEKYRFYLSVQRLQGLSYLTEDVQGTLPTLTSSTKFTSTYVIRHLKWKIALGFQRCSTEQRQSQPSYRFALLLSKATWWETICQRGVLAEKLHIPIYKSETPRSLEKCSSSLLTRAKVGFNFPCMWKPKSLANTTLHCLHSEIAKLCSDKDIALTESSQLFYHSW